VRAPRVRLCRTPLRPWKNNRGRTRNPRLKTMAQARPTKRKAFSAELFTFHRHRHPLYLPHSRGNLFHHPDAGRLRGGLRAAGHGK